MQDLPYYDFIDSDFNVNLEILIDRIKRKYSKEDLLEKYSEVMNKNYDKLQICCGHDVTNIMALAFTDKEHDGWGYGTTKHLTKERIESTLRAMYDYIKFKTTNVYNELLKWQTSRSVNLLCIESTLNVA